MSESQDDTVHESKPFLYAMVAILVVFLFFLSFNSYSEWKWGHADDDDSAEVED